MQRNQGAERALRIQPQRHARAVRRGEGRNFPRLGKPDAPGLGRERGRAFLEIVGGVERRGTGAIHEDGNAGRCLQLGELRVRFQRAGIFANRGAGIPDRQRIGKRLGALIGAVGIHIQGHAVANRRADFAHRREIGVELLAAFDLERAKPVARADVRRFRGHCLRRLARHGPREVHGCLRAP